MTAVLLVCACWWLVPLQFVWLAWLLTCVGGGAGVMNSTVYTMLADIIEESER
jgi:Na+/melibiose symporter-like transporter